MSPLYNEESYVSWKANVECPHCKTLLKVTHEDVLKIWKGLHDFRCCACGEVFDKNAKEIIKSYPELEG